MKNARQANPWQEVSLELCERGPRRIGSKTSFAVDDDSRVDGFEWFAPVSRVIASLPGRNIYETFACPSLAWVVHKLAKSL